MAAVVQLRLARLADVRARPFEAASTAACRSEHLRSSWNCLDRTSGRPSVFSSRFAGGICSESLHSAASVDSHTTIANAYRTIEMASPDCSHTNCCVLPDVRCVVDSVIGAIATHEWDGTPGGSRPILTCPMTLVFPIVYYFRRVTSGCLSRGLGEEKGRSSFWFRPRGSTPSHGVLCFQQMQAEQVEG